MTPVLLISAMTAGLFTATGVAADIAAWLLGFTKEPWNFLLLATLPMLIVGCFLELTAAINIRSGAASIIQVDATHVGGIPPWLKVAHLGKCFNRTVCPHFLMELHVAQCAAVPSAAWVDCIPQLDAVATSSMAIDGGRAIAPDTPSLGIAWRGGELQRRARSASTIT